MKIITLIYFLILLFTIKTEAQSIILMDEDEKNVISGDTVTVQFVPTNDHGYIEINIYVHAKNISEKNIEMNAKKAEFNVSNDEYHGFCFAGSCFDSSVFISPCTKNVPSGKIDSSFSAHFRFDDLLHKPSVALVSYTFYDVNNPSDSAIVYVKYSTVITDAKEEESVSRKISCIMPLPASENIWINLNSVKRNPEDLYLVVYDSNSSKIAEYPFNGSLGIETANWSEGTYFYAIYHGKQMIELNKFLIIH